jgi:hypothetical protein
MEKDGDDWCVAGAEGGYFAPDFGEEGEEVEPAEDETTEEATEEVTEEATEEATEETTEEATPEAEATEAD